MGRAETEATHRRLVEALAAGDVETITDSFAEDAVWHFPGTAFVCGEHQGRDAIVKFLLSVVEYSEGTFRLTPIAFAASENHAFAFQRITAEKGGRSLDETEAIIFEVRDGKVVEVWHRPEQDRIDAFFI